MSKLDTIAPIEQGGLMLVWNVGRISPVHQTHNIFVLDGKRNQSGCSTRCCDCATIAPHSG
ncbi:MAG: hypothetical protein E8D52_04970 [Nitrospira sp.]|nr:MAG: hypothetical protein E8D52_04970 [Nitrospira sp.]